MKIIFICFALILCFNSCTNVKEEKQATPLINVSLALANEKTDSLNKYYARGIAAFIKAMREQRKVVLDTLYLGKHEEFPDIKLPTTIENTGILVLSSDSVDAKFAYRKSLAYVNMVDLGDTGKFGFLFITFYVDREKDKTNYWPQHNCTINLNYNKSSKDFVFEKLKFDFPYPQSVIREGL